MKTNKILSILIIGFISASIVTLFLVKLSFMIPEISIVLDESEITELDMAKSFWGLDISEKKMETFKTLTNEDFIVDNTKERIENFVKFIMLPSIIITLILYKIFFKIVNNYIKSREDELKRKKEQQMKESYSQKYPVKGKSTLANCINCISYNKDLMNKTLSIWFEDEKICMINSDYKVDIGKYQIAIEDIVCFFRYGDMHTTTNISGGGSSFKRAALGYLIAGDMGAVIASREPISSNTIVHDKRETIIAIKENGREEFIFFDQSLHDYLMQNIPYKEISYISFVGKHQVQNT